MHESTWDFGTRVQLWLMNDTVNPATSFTYGVLLQLDTGKKHGLSRTFGRNIRD